MITLLAFLQTWHELDFNLGRPEDIDAFPWSAPVSVVIIAGLLFFLRKARKNYMALPELPAVVEEGLPLNVTVVIPARDEAKNIATCLKGFGDVRVIVVDDDSTDKTAALANAAGAEVIPAPALLRGVMGKPNAMMAGAKLAATDYIFFADADTRYAPAFLPSVVRYATEQNTVLVSALLRQECVTVLEKMLVPYAFALYFCGVNAANLQNELSKETAANGQCMLFLRSAYEFFGGYMSVNTSVLEDVAIAQKVKRHRMKLRILRAEHLGSARMYGSFGAICGGFRRNALRLRENGRAAAQVVFTSLLLASILPAGVWLAKQEQWPFLGALVLLPVVLLKPWYGGFGRALLCIPAIYVFQLIAVGGMVSSLFGGKTNWKGRQV